MTTRTKGVLVFLLICFGLSWAGMFIARLGLGLSLVNPLVQLAGIAFTPAIAAIVVRARVTREGFADAGLRPRLRRHPGLYLAAWLGPLAFAAVAHGDGLLFPEAVRSLAAEHAPPPGNAHGPVALTRRETEVLRLVAEGLSNQAIATRLYLSLETVKTHVRSVLVKLGAANRTEAVIMAYESGFVRPGRR